MSDVIDLAARRRARSRDLNKCMIFTAPSSIETDLLTMIGPEDGPCGVGVVGPPPIQDGNLVGVVDGWILTPRQARMLAYLLIDYSTSAEIAEAKRIANLAAKVPP